MNRNFQMKVKALRNTNFNVEVFDSASEVVRVSGQRKVTSGSFHNFDAGYMPSKDFAGVESFQEALELMRGGYQPSVDKLKANFKANLGGQAKRVKFRNDVVGFQPIIPLALQGVPNCMVNSYMKPIKAKVIDVYYDMTVHCGISTEQIIKAGQSVLSAIMELEMQGYKFNLYAIQGYYGNGGCDMLCTKVKSSNTPLDLKRISFPLTHPAYFRVIGFDWYSKTPKGTYRSAYGRTLTSEFTDEELQAGFRELFGPKCVVFSGQRVVRKDQAYIQETILREGGETK